MARHSTQNATKFIYHGWVVIDDNGGMKLTRAEPAVKANERKVALKVMVPKSIFQTPALAIDLEFKGDYPAIDKVEVSQAVQEAVKGFGLEVKIEGIPEPVQG